MASTSSSSSSSSIVSCFIPRSSISFDQREKINALILPYLKAKDFAQLAQVNRGMRNLVDVETGRNAARFISSIFSFKSIWGRSPSSYVLSLPRVSYCTHYSVSRERDELSPRVLSFMDRVGCSAELLVRCAELPRRDYRNGNWEVSIYSGPAIVIMKKDPTIPLLFQSFFLSYMNIYSFIVSLFTRSGESRKISWANFRQNAVESELPHQRGLIMGLDTTRGMPMWSIIDDEATHTLYIVNDQRLIR